MRIPPNGKSEDNEVERDKEAPVIMKEAVPYNETMATEIVTRCKTTVRSVLERAMRSASLKSSDAATGNASRTYR